MKFINTYENVCMQDYLNNIKKNFFYKSNCCCFNSNSNSCAKLNQNKERIAKPISKLIQLCAQIASDFMV